MRNLCVLTLAIGLMLALGGTAQAGIVGFGDGTGWTLNGATAAIDDGTATLTTSGNSQTSSIFYDTVQEIEVFTVQFDYQNVNPSGNDAD